MTDDALIHVRHLFKSFGSLVAVNDIGFDVQPGTCFAFLGPNGAGKTTMMKTLYGKADPDEREDTVMRVLGADPRTNEIDIKAASGVVPQENSLDLELNVLQNLRIFANFYGIPWRTARRRVDYLLDFMELEEKRTAKVRELSGGMQRRLIIARALLGNPALLILDEPTTGLDPQVRHLIWDKLRSLKRTGVTILLTTHYMDEAFHLADTLLIMDHGRKVLEGNPPELLSEHIETHVLELLNTEAREAVESHISDGEVRTEGSDERVLYYSSNLERLETMTRSLSPGEYHLRQVNLEDLFLKSTGRSLNVHQ
ncbi:MAG: ABC transporter ATP-binding protein [Spirochaetaceae bacterium]